MAHFASLYSRRIFGDSSAFAAILDRDDANHEQALDIVADSIRHHYRLITTNTILIEAHALILSTLGRAQARQFLGNMHESSTRIIRVRAQDELRAEELLTRYADKDWSFTDAISFVVMDRLGMRLAFTFDNDFNQYGFTAVTTTLLSGS